MDRITVACPDFLDHIDRWLTCVQEGNDISLLINGKEAVLLTSPFPPVPLLTDTLTGILKHAEDTPCGS